MWRGKGTRNQEKDELAVLIVIAKSARRGGGQALTKFCSAAWFNCCSAAFRRFASSELLAGFSSLLSVQRKLDATVASSGCSCCLFFGGKGGAGSKRISLTRTE